VNILKDVATELFGMFVADTRLTAAILFVVAAAAGLIEVARVPPILGGAVLVIGSLCVLVAAVLSTARGKR
jgi:hypothetical protein